MLHDKTIRNFLLKRGRTASLIEDITQDVWCKFTEKQQSLQQYITASLNGKLSPYLWKVIVNIDNDHHRGSKDKYHMDTNEPGFEDIGIFGIEEAPDGNATDCYKIAHIEFEQEHPERAKAIELSALEGWTIKELAVFLGRSEGATREYLSQCRKFLRKYTEPCKEYL